MSDVKPLFLVGFMGAGKTTVGMIVAERLGRPFIDLDHAIERATGRTVAELFDEVGEDGFREAEFDSLLEAEASGSAVVACGGGIVTYGPSLELLTESDEVVYLSVSADECLARVRDQLMGRPLLQGADPAGAAALLGLRELLYEEVADFTVDTVGSSPEQVAERIVEWVVMEPLAIPNTSRSSRRAGPTTCRWAPACCTRWAGRCAGSLRARAASSSPT